MGIREELLKAYVRFNWRVTLFEGDMNIIIHNMEEQQCGKNRIRKTVYQMKDLQLDFTDLLL